MNIGDEITIVIFKRVIRTYKGVHFAPRSPIPYDTPTRVVIYAVRRFNELSVAIKKIKIK